MMGVVLLIYCILGTKLKFKKRLRMERTSLFYLLQNVTSLKNSGQAAENTCNMVTGELKSFIC